MTEQTNENQSKVESEEAMETGFLLDLNEETAKPYSRLGNANGVQVPFGIGFENIDEKFGKYSQFLAFLGFAGIATYLYGLVELEQEFKSNGILERLSEKEREVLNIAFSVNDYLKSAGAVTENVPDTVETK